MATGGPCAFSGERIHRFHQICKVVPGTPSLREEPALGECIPGPGIVQRLGLERCCVMLAVVFEVHP